MDGFEESKQWLLELLTENIERETIKNVSGLITLRRASGYSLKEMVS